MSHCRSPQTCSVCLGIQARRVEVVGGSVVVDGSVVRSAQPGALSPQQQNAAQRGANRRGRKARR